MKVHRYNRCIHSSSLSPENVTTVKVKNKKQKKKLRRFCFLVCLDFQDSIHILVINMFAII